MSVRYKVIAFAVLHEVTVIVPLPLLYYGLKSTNSIQYIRQHIPEEYLDKGRAFSQKLGSKLFGTTDNDDDAINASDTSDINLSKDNDSNDIASNFIYLGTSYAIVKALLPVRLAICGLLTPSTARLMESSISRLRSWKFK